MFFNSKYSFRMKLKHGFTLVEIMIVVLIVALLAAIAVPAFARARSISQKNACLNNLRLIDSAKEQFALDNNKDADTVPDEDDLVKYLKNNLAPKCPAGGDYTMNSISTNPSCSVEGHVLA